MEALWNATSQWGGKINSSKNYGKSPQNALFIDQRFARYEIICTLGLANTLFHK